MNFTGSGVSRSSSDGLGGVPLELFDVVLGVLDLDGASESLHCSTSTSTSSSISGNRSTDNGPAIEIKIIFNYNFMLIKIDIRLNFFLLFFQHTFSHSVFYSADQGINLQM